MASRRNALLEQFFNSLISGDRQGAREVVDQTLEADCAIERILSHLVWPTLQQVQQLYRNDQLATLSYQYAVRLLRQIIDQMQMRLPQAEEPRNERVLVTCGNEQSEELAGQIVCDLLEAQGYEVYFAGGGVASDEIVEQLAQVNARRFVVFGAIAPTVPETRLLIDRLHEIGACPDLQIIVGGGVFNRAEGLAEEIGADLWAKDPFEVAELMNEYPHARMSDDQRTVGRKRRRDSAAA